jgi:hypothetical protein
MPSATVSIASHAAREIADPSNASGPAVRQMIVESQEQAQAELEARLKSVYQAQVARFNLEQERQRKDTAQKAVDAASEQIRAEFVAYAGVRGPVFTQLALLAGFPDPNPGNAPPAKPLPPVLAQRFQEAAELRKQLDQIDADFKVKVAKIVTAVSAEYGLDETQMMRRVSIFKDELDRRAEQEAQQQVRKNLRDLQLELVQTRKLSVPGSPANSISLPAEEPFAPVPEVPSSGILSGANDRLMLLRHELQIWAGLNDYSVVASPRSERDATGEFLSWRHKFELGR